MSVENARCLETTAHCPGTSADLWRRWRNVRWHSSDVRRHPSDVLRHPSNVRRHRPMPADNGALSLEICRCPETKAKCLLPSRQCPWASSDVWGQRRIVPGNPPMSGDNGKMSPDISPLSVDIGALSLEICECRGTTGKCPRTSGHCLWRSADVRRRGRVVSGNLPMSGDIEAMSPDISPYPGTVERPVPRGRKALWRGRPRGGASTRFRSGPWRVFRRSTGPY